MRRTVRRAFTVVGTLVLVMAMALPASAKIEFHRIVYNPPSTDTGTNSHDLRRRLKKKGVLVEHDELHLRFSQDFRFSSPSTAAGVFVGGAANGRTAWRTADGRALKAVQQARTDSGRTT